MIDPATLRRLVRARDLFHDSHAELWPARFIPGCVLMMFAQSNFGEAPATSAR